MGVARIVISGDVMLGRKVGEAIREHGPGRVWGDTLGLFDGADAVFVNLECVIATSGAPEPGRAFHFRAPRCAVESLALAGVDVATLANNHALDFGGEALRETLDRLEARGIDTTGAGSSPDEAWDPVRVRVGGMEVGVVATTDNVPAWNVDRRTPGVAYTPADPTSGGFKRLTREVQALARDASLVVVSAHWGPNMEREPSSKHREAARALVEAGADVVWGHSAHVFQGIELHEGGVIVYDAGDTVDDYRVDPEERNDLGFLFILEATRGRVGGVRLVPLLIDPRACQVNRASTGDAALARDRMRERCRALGSRVEDKEGDSLWVPVEQA